MCARTSLWSASRQQFTEEGQCLLASVLLFNPDCLQAMSVLKNSIFTFTTGLEKTPWEATVLSFRLSADSLKETLPGSLILSARAQCGSSHCMGCGGVCLRPVSAGPLPRCSSPGKWVEDKRGDPRSSALKTAGTPQLTGATRWNNVPANWLLLPLDSGGNQLSLRIHSDLSFPELFYMPAKKLF